MEEETGKKGGREEGGRMEEGKRRWKGREKGGRRRKEVR